MNADQLARIQAALAAMRERAETLDGRIINLPEDDLTGDQYLRGHRDARHAAAGLAIEVTADARALVAVAEAAAVLAEYGRTGAPDYLEWHTHFDALVRAVAEAAGVSVRTARRWRTEGEPGYDPRRYQAALEGVEG